MEMYDRYRGGRIVTGLAFAKLAFHVLTNNEYGFHRDELATLGDARHLEWGFVAYPPVTPFIGRIELVLFGTSLTGFRLGAALAQSLVMILTGAIARRLGGRATAQVLAAGCVAIAPISLSASSLFQYVAFDYLWFVLLAYFMVRLCASNDGRWWLAIGAVIGVGVLTKYTMGAFALGVVVGVIATPLRKHLRGPWLWVGVLVSIGLFMPNLAWQARHEWITLDFMRHIHERDVRIGRTTDLIPDQFWVATNPVTVPLWILGVVTAVRHQRLIAWMAVVPFGLMVALRGRGYYLGPIYPMLLASGAVKLEQQALSWRASRRSWAAAACVALFAIGSGMVLVVLPLAPPGSRWFEFVVRANDDFAEEVGWQELVDEVARIYRALPSEERAHTGIFGNNYGEAGAIDLYGLARGLPVAISGVNSYWLRGPGDPPPTTLIVLGDDRSSLERLCGSVELAGHVRNPWNVKNEETQRHPDIFVCRELKQRLDVVWPRLRHFG